MKVTQEEVVDRQTVLHVELEEEDLAPYIDQGYRRVVRRINIPGFRPGRAPRHIVERYVGREGLLNEVLDRMMTEVAQRAVQETELELGDVPGVDLLELEPVQLKVTVPLPPEVDLGDYRSIRVPYQEPQITDEDVERRLQEIREQMATWEPVDRPVQMGDLVTLNLLATTDDETLINEKEAQIHLREGEEPVLPGFAQQLVGTGRDQTKDFVLTVPEDHPSEELRGRQVHFSVTILDIKERHLPDLDDEMVKSLGTEYQSLEEFRQALRQDMEATARAQAEEEYRTKVLEALMDKATVQLAPVMVDHEAGHILEDRINTLARLNIRLDDYLLRVGKSRQEFHEEAREEARTRLSREYVLRKVAEAEDIQVSDEEVEHRLQELLDEARRQGGQEQQRLPERASQVPQESRDAVRRQMIRERTLERLVAIARGQADEGAAPPDQGGAGEGGADQDHDQPQEQEGDERDGDTA